MLSKTKYKIEFEKLMINIINDIDYLITQYGENSRFSDLKVIKFDIPQFNNIEEISKNYLISTAGMASFNNVPFDVLCEFVDILIGPIFKVTSSKTTNSFYIKVYTYLDDEKISASYRVSDHLNSKINTKLVAKHTKFSTITNNIDKLIEKVNKIRTKKIVENVSKENRSV